jgi:formamidopyrimidine-DNA glycosylase
MPELPEVETVCRGLAPVLEGHRLVHVAVNRADLRLPFPGGFAAALTGRVVTAVRRRAKYWLWMLDDGMVALGHLGMSGAFRVGLPGSNRPPPGPHDHVVIETDAGAIVTFNDPRRFGLMTLARAADLETHPLLAALGPEPLSPQFDGAVLAAALAGRRGPVKPALLDQTVVAGVGNIYACEALFRAGLSPRRRADTIRGGRAERLAQAIKAVLAEAIESGGSSLRDHRQVTGELGYFQHAFAVYGREGEPCPGCVCDLGRTGGVQRLVQGGRSTFFCATRQR